MLKKFHIPLLILISFGLGWFSLWIVTPETKGLKQSCLKKYPLISPEIDCGTINETATQIRGLQNTVTGIVEEEKKVGHITQVSVFYRDLNSRRWFGINDTATIHPASLIKLPVAMMYYKMAEFDPSILGQELTLSAEEANDNQDYQAPEDSLTPGKSYAIRDMIAHMIKYSDNAPFTPLMNASQIFHDKMLSDLGIYRPATKDQSEVWIVTTRSYANIFRMLYNASYTNIEYSSEILDILSQSTFDKGIVAGVPKDVKVSHKFGEGTGVTGEGEIKTTVLNDCGIIYKKDAPYILCIMTEGKDFQSLEKTIRRIAETSYNAL